MSNIKIAICMGSQSDWPTMKEGVAILDSLDVPCDVRIISAHRTPDRLADFSKTAAEQGFEVIIAGAGGAAHLPGMIASYTHLPVLGVPVQSKALDGMDSLLSIVQMPAGVAVATFAIGPAGAKNAALFAAEILSLQDKELDGRLRAWRQAQTNAVAMRPKSDLKK
jgi:5-(carboxyamino)imidazole ribonucleotide mutase